MPQFYFQGTTTGVLNLLSGTLSAGTVATSGSAVGYVNFNGGTLRALSSNGLISLTQNNVFIYSGGATIDTNGNSVSIANALNAPSGNGLSGVALTGSGAGYIGEPVVQITGGGGSGATARATIDSNGVLTGIVITNPGTGYTSAPTVTLVGGGPGTAATVGTVSIAANTSGGLTKVGTGTLTLTGSNSYAGTTTISNGTLQLGDGTAGHDGSVASASISNSSALAYNLVSSSTYGGIISGAGTLTKSGSGTLTLTGSNSYTGGTTVSTGKLVVSGNNTTSSLQIGNNGTAAAFYLTSGTVTRSAGSESFANSGYGYLKISGGALTGSPVWQGQGTGVITQSGGTFTQNTGQPFVLGGVNTAGGTGVFNLDGGSMSVTGNRMAAGWDASTTGRGEFNINGGSATVPQLYFLGATTGVLSLLSGTLSLGTVATSTGFNNASAVGYVNFNGGTLRAISSNALINLATVGTQNNVFIYSGGATIDTNGNSVSIANPLNAPTGNGLSSVALTGSGAGYIGEPVVQITGGGGSGATARATIDSNGVLTGIVVTNPGTGYTSTPTVTLVGGGSATAATVGTVSLAANTGGGLIKTGSGTLTLNGSNNYTGATTVNAGTLQAGSTAAFGSNPAVILANVAGAVLDLNGYNNTIGSLSGGGSSGGNVTVGSGTLTLGANNSSTTYAGGISGVGGIVKTGTGTMVLTGSNSYTGTASVNAGTLQIGDGTSGSLAAASSVTVSASSTLAINLANSGTFGSYITNYGTVNVLGSGTTWVTANMNAYGSGGFNLTGTGLTILGGDNTYYGPTNINNGTLLLNYTNAASKSTVNVINNNSLTFGVSSAILGGLAGSGNVALLNGTNGVALTVDSSAESSTYSGALSGSGGSLTKTGVGTLTLSRPNSYSGSTTVNGGALTFANLTGTNTIGAVTVTGGTAGATLNLNGATSLGSNSLTVGNASGDRSVVNVAGNLGLSGLGIGSAAGSAGALYLTSGTVTRSGGSEGFANSGYGYLKIGGGVLTGAAVWQGQGNGVITQSGGTFTQNTNQPFVLGGVNTAGGTGVFNLDGGTMSVVGNVMAVGWDASLAGRGEVNIGGGSMTIPNFVFHGATTGVLNLLSGTLSVGSIVTAGTTYNNASAVGYVNLNGGVLQAAANSTALINLATVGTQNNVFIYSGGATIDTNGNSVSIANPLNAPTGNGVNSIALTGSGAGYIGEPVVQISGGGGSGATARATINPATGVVTGIVITNPGTGYTSTPSVTLVGGGPGAAATVGTVSIAANVGGGLTKVGAGTLTLTASNSYTGTTTISNGTLQLGDGTAGHDGTVASANILDNATLTYNLSGSSIYTGAISGTGSLTKSGTGTLTLTGSNNYTGTTTVTGGKLIISNNSATSSLSIGNSGTASAFYLTSGTVTRSASNENFANTSGYGYINIAGGLLTGAAVYQGIGTGVITQSGGTFTQNTSYPFILGGFNTAGGTGVFNLDGGTMSVNHVMSVGWAASTAGRGEFNINGGSATASQFVFHGATTGVLNLLSGTLSVGSVVTGGTTNNDPSAVGYVNFNGGVLKATANSTALINLATVGTQNNVFIYSGGATIDTNGNSVSIANSLNASTGNGLNSIALTGSGAGYIAEPYVQITGGGGSGATARATIDPATGAVTGIAITNPGTGYTSTPTVSLVGGGPVAAAAVGTVSLAANDSSGGLTKTGAGTLTLSAANTYGGPSIVNSGTLVLGNSLALPASTAVTVNGVLDLHGYNAGVASLSGSGTVDTSSAGTVNLTLGSGGSFSGTVKNSSGALALILTGGNLLLSGSNSYTGGTTLNSGTLQVGNAFALGASSNALAVNGGALNLNGYSLSVGALSGSSGATITTAASGTTTLTTSVSSGTSTYSGNIADGAGSVNLVKSGSGSLILGGSIAMSGLTASSGQVTLVNSGSVGTLTVGTGATVSLAANTSGTRSVLSLSSLAIGGSSSGMAVPASAAAAQLHADSLNGNASTGALSSAAQFATELTTPEAVPEPGTAGLLFIGAFGLLRIRRRSRTCVR